MRLQRLLCAALQAELAGDVVRLPEGSKILWRAFLDLSAARTCAAGGPDPIQYSEIAAWAHLMRVPLEPEHVRLLRKLDRIWLEKVYDKRNAPEGVEALPARSEHAITPAMFDIALM